MDPLGYDGSLGQGDEKCLGGPAKHCTGEAMFEDMILSYRNPIMP